MRVAPEASSTLTKTSPRRARSGRALLSVTLAAAMLVAPLTAQAGVIGSQPRRQGTVVENEAHAERLQSRVARRLATQMLLRRGLSEAEAERTVTQLRPRELAMVVYEAPDAATARATGGRGFWKAVLLVFLFWLVLCK